MARQKLPRACLIVNLCSVSLSITNSTAVLASTCSQGGNNKRAMEVFQYFGFNEEDVIFWDIFFSPKLGPKDVPYLQTCQKSRRMGCAARQDRNARNTRLPRSTQHINDICVQ